MKTLHFFFCFLLIVIFTSSYAQNSWNQLSNFAGSARRGAVAFSIGNKGYVATGVGTVGGKDLWEYDPINDSWTQRADIGSEYARLYAVGFAIENYGYVGTGHDDVGLTNDFWQYDPASNIWAKKKKFPGDKREWAVGFSIGEKGYIGSGAAMFSDRRDFYEYDPATDTWTQIADHPGQALLGAVGFSISNKGYVVCGSKNASGVTNELWEYDPATGEWAQKSTFTGAPRDWAVGFVIGDNAYVGTGKDVNQNYLNDFWQYDPATDSWTEADSLPTTGRYQAVGFSIGSRGYVGTGITFFPNYLGDFWQYTPDCETPTGLTTTNIKSTSAKVNWNIVPGAETYNVRYRKTGTTTWTKTTVQLNYKKLQELSPNTQYDWTVKSVCDAVNNISSDWSAIQNFTTKPLKLEGENDDEEISFEVFPNPTSTTITLSLPSNQNAVLSIFNLLGEKVKEEKVTGKQVTLDVSSLPQGLYLVRVEDNVVGKFVKE